MKVPFTLPNVPFVRGICVSKCSVKSLITAFKYQVYSPIGSITLRTESIQKEKLTWAENLRREKKKERKREKNVQSLRLPIRLRRVYRVVESVRNWNDIFNSGGKKIKNPFSPYSHSREGGDREMEWKRGGRREEEREREVNIVAIKFNAGKEWV